MTKSIFPVPILLDEMMSPGLVDRLWGLGLDTIHVQYRGMKQAPDYEVWREAVQSGRCVVTANVRHFKALAAQTAVHPGLIGVPGSATRDQQFAFIQAAIFWAGRQNSISLSPFQNRVVEVAVDCSVTFETLPS